MDKHPYSNVDDFRGDPEIGEWLREKRENVGLSQLALGKLLGLRDGNYISMIERGYRAVPQTVTLIKLAIYLRLDLTDLLLKMKLIESCGNKQQLNRAVRFIEIWEHSLNLKEATRMAKINLDIAIKNPDTPMHVKKIMREAARHLNVIFDFCFDNRREKLTHLEEIK